MKCGMRGKTNMVHTVLNFEVYVDNRFVKINKITDSKGII